MRSFIIALAICIVALSSWSTTASAHAIKLRTVAHNNNLTARGLGGSCSDAPACGTSMACFSGVCAFSNGPDQCSGNSCGGYGNWGYKYQCVELAQRFFATKHGIAPIWHDNAINMCSNFPKGVSRTTSPGPGDLMVFAWQPFGHVTVIMSVSGGDVHVIEQNNMPTGQNVYKMGSEECFLTAR